MMNSSIGILITTYNDDPKILNRCLKSIYEQSYENKVIVCIDDGSNNKVTDQILFEYNKEKLIIKRIEHSERAVARIEGMKVLEERSVDYFIFIDSDMILPKNFFESITNYVLLNKCDGLIIPEIAFSEYSNFWSKVKVFERNIYRVQCKADSKSNIDAARFWSMKSFPGFEESLNAFEEIQPTIRAIHLGLRISKTDEVYILHDEKFVTLSNLLGKKTAYFNTMACNKSVNIMDVISRYYFFRPQFYNLKNVKLYILHPIIFLGVIFLYTSLTLIGVKNYIHRSFSKFLV